jgi:hypothetical protein
MPSTHTTHTGPHMTPRIDTVASKRPRAHCVALRVTGTIDQPDGDVEISVDLPRVATGDPEITLRGLLAYRLCGDIHENLQRDIDKLGTLNAGEPLQLERLVVGDNGLAVHIEALILPSCPGELEDIGQFEELLSDVEDPYFREELAWEWAQDLADVWRRTLPDERIPTRFLDPPSATLGLPAAPVAPLKRPLVAPLERPLVAAA